MKGFYERKAVKTNKIVATKAVAHKLARAAYHDLLDEVRRYGVPHCTGEILAAADTAVALDRRVRQRDLLSTEPAYGFEQEL
jgi:hypothetical protein